MDAAHALLQPVGVPWNVVVEQDVTALEIDAFAGRLGGHQHLNGPFAKLLLGMETAPGLVARAGLHAPVDTADAETPGFQLRHQVVEGILELGE